MERAGPPRPGLTGNGGKTILKHRSVCLTLLSLLILLTLGFIWGNSMMSIPESQEISLSYLDKLSPILNTVFGPGRITDHLLRKTAHFCEFALLGAELRLLLLLLGQRGLQGLSNALFAGLAAGVTDETIQIFSQRGSRVADVVLDFSGALFGALIVTLIALLHRRRQARKTAFPGK